MGHLVNYVDLKDYCDELCIITNLDINDVEEVVLTAFAYIQKGVISATKGFVFIENQLQEKIERKNGKSLSALC